MSRFVQPVPPPVDPYAGDGLLRSWLERHLGPGGHAAAKGRLADLAADVTGPLRAAHADAEAHPPTLVRYDPWGARVDRVDTSAGWQAQRAAAARHAVVALPYLPDARGTWGAAGAGRAARPAAPVRAGVGDVLLPGRDGRRRRRAAVTPDVDATSATVAGPADLHRPGLAVTSGQWMTESQGGSDLGRSSTARPGPAADGSWRLTGEKWFCSASTRRWRWPWPGPRAPAGAAGCSPRSSFPATRSTHRWPTARRRAHPPGCTVHRLKDKLGTRALPTAEIGLRDAYAAPAR